MVACLNAPGRYQRPSSRCLLNSIEPPSGPPANSEEAIRRVPRVGYMGWSVELRAKSNSVELVSWAWPDWIVARVCAVVPAARAATVSMSSIVTFSSR